MKAGKGGKKMNTILVENNGNVQRAYNSLLVRPRDLSVLCSELPLKIIGELTKSRLCAMDLARNLDQHEQKIYYHLRRLEKSGIIKMVSTEKRYGMTAKMYDVVSPVIATKLYNDGYTLPGNSSVDPEVAKFLHPFIEDGKLNAKIIIGDPYPHGEHDGSGLDGVYATDLALLLGNYAKNITFPCYKADIRVKESDLRENLFIVGGFKGNIIMQKVNNSLPIMFDPKNGWAVKSTVSDKVYDNDLVGFICRTQNPFNKDKEIIVLAGRRTRGTTAAVLAFAKHIDKIIQGNSNNPEIKANVVIGRDVAGDGAIDDVKFLE